MEEEPLQHQPPDEDRTPTQEDAPAPPKPNEWTMPEPVFRKSSGYLPQGFAERLRPADEAGGQADPEGAAPASPAAAEMPIAAQPDVDDAAAEAPPPVEIEPVPKKKRGILRVLLMILGLIIAFAAIAAVATIVVFWYFFQTGESQNLN